MEHLVKISTDAMWVKSSSINELRKSTMIAPVTWVLGQQLQAWGQQLDDPKHSHDGVPPDLMVYIDYQ